MSSLPISYTGYCDDEATENHHILIPSPSSILLLNNNSPHSHHLHHPQQHQQQHQHPNHHNHRSITMSMLQHQQLVECFAQDQIDLESVSSSYCCSPPSASSSMLPAAAANHHDETTSSSCGSASLDVGRNNYLHHHHQKGSFDSFDSNHTNSSSVSAVVDERLLSSSRNDSFSSFHLMEEQPIFIHSPSNSIYSPSEEHVLSSSLDNNNNAITLNNNSNNSNNDKVKEFSKLSFTNNSTNNQHYNNPPTIRSSPRDIKSIATSKVAYSLNDTKSTQSKGQIEEGISELEQLFASRRAFNSLSKKYSTDNLLKEQKKRNKHSTDKDHLLLLQQQHQPSLTSASSFTATTSTSFLEPSSNAIRSTKSTSCLSPSSPISDSFEEIKSIIQAYYNYESFVESADGREELRLYLRKRHNEEMLLMLETRITFLSFYEEGSNFYVGRRALLKVKEFQMIYSQFIDTNSQFCINIDSSIRNKFVKLNPRVNKVNTEEEAALLVKEIDECLDTLHFSVSLQVKTEIFSQFKKTEEFQTFILSKIIELQGKKAWEGLERQNGTSLHDSPSNHGGFFSFLKKNPQNSAIKKFEEKLIEEFLIENELAEYCGQFRKKKLYTLSQIQNYSCDDYLKLGVIKVTHQTRLIRLVGQYFKSYCNKN